uniref:Parvin beta n=1 Tax=Suricata suricatta TaxID=37032 RepID=A0A673UCL7_SURSU
MYVPDACLQDVGIADEDVRKLIKGVICEECFVKQRIKRGTRREVGRRYFVVGVQAEVESPLGHRRNWVLEGFGSPEPTPMAWGRDMLLIPFCPVVSLSFDQVLIDWINDVLAEERIIVKQLEEDLYDGQVLQKLLEKLAGCKLNVAEVTQSEIGQKQKLQTVLEAVHGLLRPHGWPLRWAVDSIHGKNLVAILHLLVSLAMHFRAPIRLPEHVSVQVVVVRKREGLLHSSHVTEELTTTTEMMMGRFERDAFDTLFDHAPDKLSVVKKSLITFVNKHLNKLNLEVTELETQFADGVYLVLLMGLLEDYFVPLHNFYLTPESFDQKVRAWSPSSGRPRTRVSPRTAWSMPPVALLGVGPESSKE